MKHLKTYNESSSTSVFTVDEINDVKDIFQDLIDDHDMEPYDQRIHGENSSVVYLINKFSNQFIIKDTNSPILYITKIQIILINPCRRDLPLKYKHQEKLDNDIINFITRLELIGFKAFSQYFYDYENSYSDDLITYQIRIDITK